MIQQGRRKLYTRDEKLNYLNMFNEQGGGDYTRFAQSCEVPVGQFRLWLQQTESGLELQDSKPLPKGQPMSHGFIKRGNGKGTSRKAKKAEHPASEPYYADQLTKTYWCQQLLRARVNGRDKVAALHEVFMKATGFTTHTITNWTADYLTTPRGKKFERSIQPKPALKPKAMPGRPAHTRYKNPETGKAEYKIQPEYWNRLVEMITALDKDLRGLIFRMDVQNQRLDEFMALWK